MLLNSDHVLTKLTINRDTKKCFIFDLDGTIIFNNQHLSADNEALLKLISDSGHQLIFATGRPFKDFKAVMPHWTYECPLTAFSGGVSLVDSEVIRSHSIKQEYVAEIVKICVDKKYRFIMDSLTHYYHPDITNAVFGFLDNTSSSYRQKNLDKILDSKIYKILLFDLEAIDFFTEYAHSNNLLIKLHSYDKCFDIVPEECNKHLGILPFIDNYAQEDIFVFGNDFNDYELFTNYSNGVLFGNIEELQSIASINIHYTDQLQCNFNILVHTILRGN